MYSTFLFKSVCIISVISLFSWEFKGTPRKMPPCHPPFLGNKALCQRICFSRSWWKVSHQKSSNTSYATHGNQARKTVQEVPRENKLVNKNWEVSPYLCRVEKRIFLPRRILVVEVILWDGWVFLMYFSVLGKTSMYIYTHIFIYVWLCVIVWICNLIPIFCNRHYFAFESGLFFLG